MINKGYFKYYCICAVIIVCFLPGCVSTGTVDQGSAGIVRFDPEETEVKVDDTFSHAIRVNTGKQRLAAYAFLITYPPEMIGIDIAKGTEGVEAGRDGYLAAVNTIDPGKIYVGGYDINGKGPNQNLHLLTIHWKALSAGFIKVNIEIINLNDEQTGIVGKPKGTGAKIKIGQIE
ncbi:MAG: hypothetical protein JW881_19755 [Spirochaetales bacterium]|nr:hypothetical protein [Spirochaetales bacterium]